MKLNKEEKQFLLGLLQDAKTQTINNHAEVLRWLCNRTITDDAFNEFKKAYNKKIDFLNNLEQKIKGSDEK